MKPSQDTRTDRTVGKKHRRLRHIVEMKDGKPEDKCLCGYVWDVFPIPYDQNSVLCQKCVEEHQRREGGNN